MTGQPPHPAPKPGTYIHKLSLLTHDAEVTAMFQDTAEQLNKVAGFAAADTLRAAIVFLYENTDQFLDEWEKASGGWSI